MYLLIDNYDSFTYNLVQYLGELGAKSDVYRNDAITVEEAVGLEPTGIILSPGPCRPEQAGICCDLAVAASRARIPLLGVCLGHQALGHAFGARVVQHTDIVHGKTDNMHHDNTGLFKGLPSPISATRYHSLIIDRDSVPRQFSVNAWLSDGVVMALRHRELPLFGLQFHPESIATEQGHKILRAFLKESGLNVV